MPDVAVEITPDDWRKGIDAQLLKAVDVVAADVKEWKVKKSAIASGHPAPSHTPTSPSAAPMPVAPMPKTLPLAPPGERETPPARIPLADGE